MLRCVLRCAVQQPEQAAACEEGLQTYLKTARSAGSMRTKQKEFVTAGLVLDDDEETMSGSSPRRSTQVLNAYGGGRSANGTKFSTKV